MHHHFARVLTAALIATATLAPAAGAIARHHPRTNSAGITFTNPRHSSRGPGAGGGRL
jgi:hypothetical protein